MSKFVKIKTELRDLALIKTALADLKISYRENSRFVHVWSGFTGTVPLLIEHKGVKFGLRQRDDGSYEAIGDDLQLRRIQPSFQRIQQRYAYHKVLAETEKAGFSLVEERVDQGNVIRMTVRRWQ